MTKKNYSLKKVYDLKHFISERHFWEGCVCCGAPKIKKSEIKIADIDG